MVEKQSLNRRTIKVDYLTRVEGEGSLTLHLREGRVESVALSIFESPRLFEALLRGKPSTEAPDITSRICGICPIAYQMSAVHAIENAYGVTLPEHLRLLRRLLYCGEWIESHTLHVYMLHAPDFLGLPDGLSLAEVDRERVLTGLKLKKIGNEILKVFGGREIHPINVKVGGFYRLPPREKVQPLYEQLNWAKKAAADTLGWCLSLNIPHLVRNYHTVALSHPREYPMNEGSIASSCGLSLPMSEYENFFVEEQVPHSTALHSKISDAKRAELSLAGTGNYLVGPLARYNLHRHLLAPPIRGALDAAQFPHLCTNPFAQIVVRAAEIWHACEEASSILANYDPTLPASLPFSPRAGTGMWATEAPRGLLYHRYELAEDGTILLAKIVPPTAQNQATIEDDVREVAIAYQDLPDLEFTARLEQTIRNFDPCISCATHFLKVHRVVCDKGPLVRSLA